MPGGPAGPLTGPPATGNGQSSHHHQKSWPPAQTRTSGSGQSACQSVLQPSDPVLVRDCEINVRDGRLVRASTVRPKVAALETPPLLQPGVPWAIYNRSLCMVAPRSCNGINSSRAIIWSVAPRAATLTVGVVTFQP